MASIARSRDGGARYPKAAERQLPGDFLAHEVGLQGAYMPLSHNDYCWPSPHFNTMIASMVDLPCGKTVQSLWPLAGRRLERLRNRFGPEPRPGCPQSQRELAAIKRGSGAMHAESRELIGEAYSNAQIAMGTPPISPSARLVSTDLQESGLWLWQGEAPPTSALPRSKSRNQQFLRRIMPATGWVGWIAVPAGLALAFFAVSVIPHPDRPVSADRPAVALSSAPSRAVTPPIVPVPPAERTEAKSEQVQVPSALPAAKIAAQGPEPPVVKGGAQHKLSRIARKTHASHVRKRPLFPRPGVLTPPPMTWHGGGY